MGVGQGEPLPGGALRSTSDLARARYALREQQRREDVRQGRVLQVYLASGMVVALYYMAHVTVLHDPHQRFLAWVALAMAAAFGVTMVLAARGMRSVAGVLAQVIPVVPAVAFSAVFSVEAGYTSLLFVSALGAVVTIQADHTRSRFAVIVIVLASLVVVQVFLGRDHALAPLGPHATAQVATVNREVMTAGLFTLALVLTRGVQTSRRLVEASLAVSELAANTDPLTGLANRRPVWERVSELEHEGKEFALALIDIDHFKRLNDEFGHDCGDESLRHVAEVLATHSRPDDVVGRWGGEEFVMVIPGGAHQAKAASERLRADIAAVAPYCLRADHPITVSIGLAARLEGESALATLRRADAALYVAKDEGRNRVVVAGAASG